MIINEELFQLEDQCETLVQNILSSAAFLNYQKAKTAMAACEEVQLLKKTFLEHKASFERIQEYGNYLPDYREKQRAVRKAKRALDMNEKVADFRAAETQLQGILDTIGLTIAETISTEIKVDAGNPFFVGKGHSGCGGSCHAS